MALALSTITEVGSRSGASLAVVMEMPETTLKPLAGTTISPVINSSKLRYFVVARPSIALVASCPTGLFAVVGKTTSRGEKMGAADTFAGVKGVTWEGVSWDVDVPWAAGSRSEGVTVGREHCAMQRAKDSV
jgi:hypothetical protein